VLYQLSYLAWDKNTCGEIEIGAWRFEKVRLGARAGG
jgi:hypothetical protein